ncbi:hypothetical protein BDV12DRAFT_9387 [Aspergillus spectabilis]
MAPGEAYVRKLEAFLGVNWTVVDSNELRRETSGHVDVSIAEYFEDVGVPALLLPYSNSPSMRMHNANHNITRYQTYNYIRELVPFTTNFQADYFKKFHRYPYSTLNAPGTKSNHPLLSNLSFVF